MTVKTINAKCFLNGNKQFHNYHYNYFKEIMKLNIENDS